ncbi:hypothetical protein JCM11641_000660 [Rhodosporidiobolus odoratus]
MIIGAAACIYWVGGFAVSQTSLAAFAQMGPIVDGWVAACLAVDFLITASLAYYLYYKPRKLVGEAARSSPLMRLVVLACETNTVSLIVQSGLVGLSVYSIRVGTLHYLIMAFLEPEAYMACVIITLNARSERGDGNSSNSTGSKAFGLRFHLGGGGNGSKSDPGRLGARSVHVHVEHDIAVDDPAGPDEYALQNSLPYSVKYAEREEERADLEKRVGGY